MSEVLGSAYSPEETAEANVIPFPRSSGESSDEALLSPEELRDEELIDFFFSYMKDQSGLRVAERIIHLIGQDPDDKGIDQAWSARFKKIMVDAYSSENRIFNNLAENDLPFRALRDVLIDTKKQYSEHKIVRQAAFLLSDLRAVLR